ncbi:MAG: thioesterase [Lachnospiraceae bacterium]|nr:thioesterase [Lachnospiraceae bacterium]
MYKYEIRVGYSDVDENKVLRLHSLINYFQNCSTFHSEDCGLGFEYLEREHRVWILCAWQLNINRLPGVNERVEVSTCPYEFGGIIGRRNFFLRTLDGELLVCADSTWTFENSDTYTPVKIRPQDVEAYVHGEPYDMEYLGRRIPLPDNFEKREPFAVLYTNLDSNHHVNNGQYIGMAEQFFKGGKTNQLRVEYKKSAKLGDIIYPLIGERDGKEIIVLGDETGKPYAVLERS